MINHFIIEKLERFSRGQIIGLWAVRNFPDAIFFSHTSKKYSSKKSPSLTLITLMMNLSDHSIFAVVQYKNQESRKLLLNTLENAKGSAYFWHSKYLWLAVTKYPDPIYQGITDMVDASELNMIELNQWLKRSRLKEKLTPTKPKAN